MILLEFGNKILENTVREYSKSELKARKVECADFDGCSFVIALSENKETAKVSMSWRAWTDLAAHGAEQVLAEYYGSMVSTPESGYDFGIEFAVADCTEELATKVSLMKSKAFSAPFLTMFAKVEGGSASPDVVTLNYRDGEALYLKPEGDRVIVVFSISFKDDGDQIIGKVFLQEFSDMRRTMRSAPTVAFRQKEAPLELEGVPGVIEGDNQGFVSFTLFKGHLSAKNRDGVILLLQTFRNYLHYHIKCAKANMHKRMRDRVELLLKVLNRAKMERKTELKTSTGRSFVRPT